MFRRRFLKDATGFVAAAGLLSASRRAAWAQDETRRMRRVWLRLLVNLIEADVRAGKKLTEQQRYLAGLTGVRFLYVDEQNKDLILEGPAEDKWTARPDGMVVGQESGRPLLQLDDFAVAWRNTLGNSPAPSVSLEPRVQSIQRIQEFIRNTPQPTTAAARADYTRRLQDAWGPQDAVTGGVPTNTRFNKLMVDADWEMKRISLGLSDTGIEKFPTYIDLEFEDWRRRVLAEGIRTRRPEGGSRFWFYPAYAEFPHSEQLDAVQIPGDAVSLLTEGHFRDLAHGRQVTPEPSVTAKEFVKGFTTRYAELAQKNPLFADLHNLFDWVAIARLIQKIDAPRRIGWDMGFLLRGYGVGEMQVPSTMPGQIGLRHAEVKSAQGLASLVLPARGGVSMDVNLKLSPQRALGQSSLKDQFQRVSAMRPVDRRFWT
jgi:hypothetical protein